MQKNRIADALTTLTPGPEVVVDNLTMIPLIAREPRPSSLDYLVLDDALASGDVEITEISEQGSVPELRVVNRGSKPVLIVDGEELIGAKQNRVVNLTILVPAHAELTVPVSCVEAGRWSTRSRSFTTAPRTQYGSGRAKRMAHVSCSMALSGERTSNQVDVWNDISEKSSRLKARSATAAMGAIFTAHEHALDSFVNRLSVVEGQVGAVFGIGGRIVGYDMFDGPYALERLLPKLVRAAAIDAIDSRDAADPGSRAEQKPDWRQQTLDLLQRTAESHVAVHSAVGLGDDCRLNGPALTGAALVVGRDVVHVGAFVRE